MGHVSSVTRLVSMLDYSPIVARWYVVVVARYNVIILTFNVNILTFIGYIQLVSTRNSSYGRDIAKLSYLHTPPNQLPLSTGNYHLTSVMPSIYSAPLLPPPQFMLYPCFGY